MSPLFQILTPLSTLEYMPTSQTDDCFQFALEVRIEQVTHTFLDQLDSRKDFSGGYSQNVRKHLKGT